MASLEELRATRLNKLELLRKAGMETYPAKVPRDFSLKEARAKFAEFEEGKGGDKAGKPVSLTGRILAIRGQGAILFLVLDDGTATFQAVIKKDTLTSVRKWLLLLKKLYHTLLLRKVMCY